MWVVSGKGDGDGNKEGDGKEETAKRVAGKTEYLVIINKYFLMAYSSFDY
jgi:hypothetical protein